MYRMSLESGFYIGIALGSNVGHSGERYGTILRIVCNPNWLRK
jgi:hypothetical protein